MAKSYEQVVLLGDSLFEQAVPIREGFSFHAAVQARCIRRLDVVNRGFSGWNTRNVLQYMAQIFLPPSESTPKIKYLLVLLGANDACEDIPTCTQGVPLDEYKANLEKIITHPHITAHSPSILLVTPPPLDQTKLFELDLANGHKSHTRTAKRSALFSQAARDVAAKVPGTILVDLQKVLMEKAVSMTEGLGEKDWEDGKPLLGHPGHPRGGLEKLLPDGLHLSGEAYQAFFDAVKDHIGPFASDKNEDLVFPGWRVLNPGNI